MCDGAARPYRLDRRSFLAAGSIGVAGLAVARPAHSAPAFRTVRLAQGLDVVPRSEWGADLVPTAAIPDEPDVRVLVVHHTVNANTYGPGDVPGILRSIFGFHTTDKGWPDLAYNFFVDRFGTVWEGRTGSLDGTKAGDATGGNQGFSQLCAFVGNHEVEPPSPEATAAMGRLLGWLADRSRIDPSEGATATFVSRGSNRHPAGSTVTTSTIAGHRDMSQTVCPGDAAFALVTDGTFARLAVQATGVPAAPMPADPEPPETTTTSTPAPTTTEATTTSTPAPSTTDAPPPEPAEPPPDQPGGDDQTAAPEAPSDDGGARLPPFLLPGGAAAAAIGAVVAAGVIRRRQALAGERVVDEPPAHRHSDRR